MRLIDADALIENLKNLILPNIPEEGEEGNFDNFLSNIILNQAIEDIENAPTVDAVEVVRCQDCNKSEEWPNGRWCRFFQASVNTDSYCYYGAERKERREE